MGLVRLACVEEMTSFLGHSPEQFTGDRPFLNTKESSTTLPGSEHLNQFQMGKPRPREGVDPVPLPHPIGPPTPVPSLSSGTSA